MNRVMALAAIAISLSGCGDRTVTEEVPVKPVTWTVDKKTDPLTDTTSVVIYKPTVGGLATLRIECGSDQYSVDLMGGEFVPDNIGGQEQYYVSYRFDQRPPVKNETWPGSGKYALPPDKAKFLKMMLASEKAFVRVASSKMSSSEGGIDLAGLDAALTDARSVCKTLPDKGAWPE